MKSRPILFSAPMVRALLAGSKTQTRRICKNQPYNNGFHFDGQDILCHDDYLPPSAMLMDIRRGNASYTASNLEGWETECPYGQPGDQLWVRETFRVSKKHDATAPRDLPLDRGLSIAYAAGGMMCRDDVGGPYISHPTDDLWDAHWMGKTRVSIHMPRAASRITLEIVGIRVERLQDISEADALAEGITCENVIVSSYYANGHHEVTADRYFFKGCDDEGFESACEAYAALWESINGAGSWDANPWVWVVEFRRIEA